MSQLVTFDGALVTKRIRKLTKRERYDHLKEAEELGIVLDVHTGFSWVPPGKSKYALPIQLDDVARDFPNLKIIAFHMGYPYCDDLNMVAVVAGFESVDAAWAFLDNPDLKAKMREAGVVGQPRIEIYEEVEAI